MRRGECGAGMVEVGGVDVATYQRMLYVGVWGDMVRGFCG